MGKKGTVALEIDDSGLRASLVFTPDESGEVCSRKAVEALLKKLDLPQKESSTLIETFLKQIEQSAGVVSVPAAEGTPPEPPSEGKYQWEELPVPEELLPDAERIFKTALDPEIFEERAEKVKVRKKIREKAKFPFKKESVKLVTVIEKRVKKIPVEVDPAVVATGWADSGTLLAEKGAPAEGKEGCSVTGTPIPPGEPVRETVYCGRGVKAERNRLTAEVSGFVRRGSNWVEIIPFKNHFWEVILSKDKATPLLNLKTGDEMASPPLAVSIIKKALELGFSESSLISSEKITKVINETVGTGAYLENYPLSKDKDASCTISVSEDRLKGLLTLEKGSGNGKPLKLSEAGEAIKKSGFTGLNYKKIKEDLVAFYRSSETVLKDYVLSEGKAPGKGEPAAIVFECTFMEAGECRELLKEIKKKSDDDFPLSQVQRCASVDKDSIVVSIAGSKPGPPGRDVYGEVIPGEKGDFPEIHLGEHVKQEGDTIVSTIDGILLHGEDEEGVVFLHVVYNRQNALHLDVTEDGMHAYLSVHGGLEAGITDELIRKALKERGVVKGIDEESIASILNDIKAEKDCEHVPVAAGKEPVHEGKSRFRLAVDVKGDTPVSIGDDGNADYKNQDRITVVTKGMKLGTILSPDFSAEDGWDVTGRVVKAEKAPPLELERGDNIVEEKDERGNITLVAETGGELFFDTKRISVKNVHVVKGDIGLKEGNVTFPGSVKVGGNVTPGFFVMAEGEVQIAGSVEASLISSGESIIIGQGVVGGGRAVLRSRKDIDMAFAEQAVILAVGNIRIKNSCLRCRVKCNGTLALVSDKGDLIGGQIKTTGGLSAHNVGNKSAVQTEISFGQNYLVQDQIEKEEKDLEKLKVQMTKLDSMMHRFEKEGKKSHVIKARKQKVLLMKSIEKKGVRLFTLKEKFEEHFPSEIRIRGTLYPGVVFESHGRFFEVKQEKKGVRIFFDEEKGHIVNEPLKKEGA